MLKTKLAYIALGAVIASFGYFIGTLKNDLNAQLPLDTIRVKNLFVDEKIYISDPQDTGTISIVALDSTGLIISELLPDDTVVASVGITEDRITIGKTQIQDSEILIFDDKGVGTKITHGEIELVDLSSFDFDIKATTKLATLLEASNKVSRLTLSLKDKNPSMEMHKPERKNITLSIDKQAEIKLNNGGLKSKTVAVD